MYLQILTVACTGVCVLWILEWSVLFDELLLQLLSFLDRVPDDGEERVHALLLRVLLYLGDRGTQAIKGLLQATQGLQAVLGLQRLQAFLGLQRLQAVLGLQRLQAVLGVIKGFEDFNILFVKTGIHGVLMRHCKPNKL